MKAWKFPGGPVLRTQHFHCRGPGSIPGRGTKILQAMLCRKKERKKGMEAIKIVDEEVTLADNMFM